MKDSGRYGAMNGEDRQFSHVRARLSHLLATHLQDLPHHNVMPEVGEVLIREGDPSKDVLLVLSGELTVEVKDASGQDHVVATVGANELIGEMALIGDNRHSATVTVRDGPAELIAIKADDLLLASLYDSDLVMELLALSSARCRQANHQLALILDGLEAIKTNDRIRLEQCCLILRSDIGQARAADLLLELKHASL